MLQSQVSAYINGKSSCSKVMKLDTFELTCSCLVTLGDQPGLKREIGHKPIRGLCQRLKGKVLVSNLHKSPERMCVNESYYWQANRDDSVVT